MGLLTKEQLQERFKLSREKQAKKKEAERKKRKEESDKRRKATMAELNRPRKINLVKLDTSTEKEWKHYVVDNASSIISRILVGDIYETREELMEAEKRGEGKLNWEFFDKLVKEVRKELN